MEDLDVLIKNDRAEKAMQLFRDGYNCAQAVFLSFSDLYNMDEKDALRLSSSFGGGMGRLREVCGAVSGMFMAAGMLYGYYDPADYEGKKQHYARIQELAHSFEEINGSIICRVLLGLEQGKDVPVPEKRTEEYYKKRPCVQLVGIAASLLDEYVNNHPVE
ncbi:MAG: C-GCAxxG-C-C family protein [Lachnospiraceae bacterium]